MPQTSRLLSWAVGGFKDEQDLMMLSVCFPRGAGERTRDEQTKRPRGSKRDKHAQLGMAETLSFPTLSFVTKSLTSSWDHGCLELQLNFLASLAARGHRTEFWPGRCRKRRPLSEMPALRTGHSASPPSSLSNTGSGHGWPALPSICGPFSTPKKALVKRTLWSIKELMHLCRVNGISFFLCKPKAQQ